MRNFDAEKSEKRVFRVFREKQLKSLKIKILENCFEVDGKTPNIVGEMLLLSLIFLVPDQRS